MLLSSYHNLTLPFILRLFFHRDHHHSIVSQASDPGDDIAPYPKDCADMLQPELPLLVKECTPSPGSRRGPATIVPEGEKITDSAGRSQVIQASRHRLPDVHEIPQQHSTTASLALGPPPPPSCPDGSSLHPPGTPGIAHQCFNVDNPALAHSPPSEHSQHSCPPNKELGDAIFGTSDEELSSLSDADTVLGTVRASAEPVQPRRVRRTAGSAKRCTRSQHSRNTPLSTKPIPVVSSLDPTPDAAAEQKLVPVVKGLRVMDSQDTMREKLLDTGGQNSAGLSKRKKVLIESGDELHASPVSTSKESPLPTLGDGPKDPIVQAKTPNAVATVQPGRTTNERPKRACVLSTARMKVRPKPRPSTAPNRSGLDNGSTEKNTGGMVRNLVLQPNSNV